MAAKYKYVFNSLRTEQVIQEIDLYGVYLSLGLNGDEGQFDGTFTLDQTGKRNQDLLDATEPGMTFLVPERNGVPIGAWFIWSRVYSAQSKTAQLHGKSFEQFPRSARILTNLSYSNLEQRELFKTLWTHLQTSAPGRNVNVNVPSGTFPNVKLKSVSVLATDTVYYNEVMSAIADAVDGFDWYVAVTKEGNYYRKDLRIGYPNLGTAPGSNIPVFEYPGNVTQYYKTESLANAGTHILVIGAGEGSSMITSEVAHDDLINNGMIRIDLEVARKDITSQSLLNTVAANEGANRRPPMTVIKMTVKGDAVPEFGAYNLGDSTRIVLKDSRHPAGYTKDTRVIKWELKPLSSESVEEASLHFVGDPD